MSIQVIKKKGKPDYLVIPYEEFLEFANDELIEAAYIQGIIQDPVEGEIVDFDFADYVDNPVVVARLNAGLTQSELAKRMGVSQAYISKLERSEKVSPKALKKIAACLDGGAS